MPLRRDFLIMNWVMSNDTSNEEMLSMSRVRDLLCVIFVSNIFTANGKYLEEFATHRISSKEHASK